MNDLMVFKMRDEGQSDDTEYSGKRKYVNRLKKTAGNVERSQSQRSFLMFLTSLLNSLRETLPNYQKKRLDDDIISFVLCVCGGNIYWKIYQVWQSIKYLKIQIYRYCSSFIYYKYVTRCDPMKYNNGRCSDEKSHLFHLHVNMCFEYPKSSIKRRPRLGPQ